jgi:hypothetical protein
MTQEMQWLDSHVGSIQAGVALINRLGWNIEVRDNEHKWFVLAGEKVVFAADTQDAVDAFLYGMALAYSILPDSIIETVRKEYDIPD